MKFNVSIPSSAPERSVLNISYLRGVDLHNSPPNVDASRSPEAPNMVRDVPGKVRKRMGYRTLYTLPGRINGHYSLTVPVKEGRSVETREIIHAGTKLFLGKEEIFDGMQDARSRGWQMGGKLYLQDGENFFVYGREEPLEEPEGEEEPEAETWSVKKVSDAPYIPTVIIARAPNGGGTAYEPVNMLSDKWTDSFLGTESDTVYQLSFGELSEEKVTGKLLQQDGTEKDLTEDTDFTVDRQTGKVTFKSAPGKSPVTGKDNIQLTAAKDRSESRRKIERCGISVLYGVAGAADRLFVSGNPEWPNYDWYSQMNDPSYFGDTWYSVLGQDSSRIVGYSVLSDRLAAHKDKAEDGRNVIIRRGELTEQANADGSVSSRAAFPITGTLQGEGAVSPYAFGYLGTEPLFLSQLGVYAITQQDITGEKYSQNRSFYINNQILNAGDLSDCFSFVWRDFYLLTVKDRIYLLDGLQKTYEKGTPYSNYQYECYYWNITARVLWEDASGALCFGTEEGAVRRFASDPEDILSYNDDGRPIEAWWDMADFNGIDFYKNKTVRYFAIRLAAATATGFTLQVQVRGLWQTLKELYSRARYLAFSRITFSKFTFSCDTTPKTIGQKVKVKKVDKARFRIYNAQLNEPLGIYEIAIEFTESGKYKR